MENIDEAPSVVASACVLHNFCFIADDEDIDEFFDDSQDGDDDDDDDDDCELPIFVPRPLAVAKRNQMVIFLDN